MFQKLTGFLGRNLVLDGQVWVPWSAILCRTALWRNKAGNFFPNGFDLRGDDTISHTPSQQKWRLDCDAGRLPSSDEMRKEDVCIFCRQGVENRDMRRDDIAVLGKMAVPHGLRPVLHGLFQLKGQDQGRILFLRQKTAHALRAQPGAAGVRVSRKADALKRYSCCLSLLKRCHVAYMFFMRAL